MNPITRAMTQVLLDHHREVCHRPDGTVPDHKDCVITYGDLCQRAGVPFLTQNPGQFLCEIADWCAARGYPPLNALAVMKDGKVPGFNYDKATGCSLANWPAEAQSCVAFRGYPENPD